MKRSLAASAVGQIEGVLFFQGESDAIKGRVDEWPDRFEELVTNLRRDLNRPGLPVVFAQLGNGDRSADPAAWKELQERQAQLTLAGVAMITTADLSLADDVHFTSESYEIIGQRFAEALHRLVNKRPDGQGA